MKQTIRTFFAFAGIYLLLAVSIAPAMAQSKPFFEGKTLTMVNNYPAGGASGTEGLFLPGT